MKKIIAAILIISLVHQNLFASILLPSLEVPSSEFQAKVETSREKYQSFTSYYLAIHPMQENVNELLELFEKAQMFYFSKSTDQAKEIYSKILFMADIDEWREVHRKIFFMSYMRLAEIDTASEQEYLQKAILFAPEINLSDLEVSKEIKEKVKKLRNDQKSLEWNVTGFKKDFKFIIMNGHVINLQKTNKVIIPYGKFRITFLSDYYKPQTMNVGVQQVPLLRPVKTTFVNGSCLNSKVLNDVEIKDYETYFGKDCSAKEEKVAVAALSPAYSHMPSETSFMENPKPIYKKTWFWVAVGAVAAGTVYYMVQKNKREDSKPEEPSREIIQ